MQSQHPNTTDNHLEIIERISPQIGPQMRALLWVSNEPFSTLIPLLNGLDYFFDGVLNKGLYNHAKEQDFSLFTTKSFGDDLYLACISENESLTKNINSFLDVLENNIESRQILLIPNKVSKETYSLIEKRLRNKKYILKELEEI